MRIDKKMQLALEADGEKLRQLTGEEHGPIFGSINPHETRRLLPSDAAERKKYPMCAGLVDYFPDALAAVANVSWRGNDQHNPGEPVHWARGKSTDQADTLMRHLVQRGTLDVDGMRHSAKLAWRALALLQEELEAELGLSMPRGARETEREQGQRIRITSP